MLLQRWLNVPPHFHMYIEFIYLEVGLCIFPANTKHFHTICTTSSQRLRRWSNIVQMLYKCFVFAGLLQIISDITNDQYFVMLVTEVLRGRLFSDI